jgi:molybdopterin-guanine dinucleotide biosynthesis protein A
MSVAGYVLAGGNSSRMGTDKAKLQMNGISLAARTASFVHSATGSATLVGDPAKYGDLGFRVIPDRRTGQGPLAGMEVALADSNSEWTLIVACDLVALRQDFLSLICGHAVELPQDIDCLIPSGPDHRWQPLSGVYRQRCLPVFSAALDAGNRKVTAVLASLKLNLWQTELENVFQNINTPEEWIRYINGRPQ